VFVVDTNILLYALNPDAPEHKRAHAEVEQYRRGAALWFLTWSIVYEFLRVSTHRAVFDRPLSLDVAWSWVDTLRACPSCRMLVETERHAEIVRELATRHPRLVGNPVHDLHTAALMLEHGVMEVRTADTDFHQFPFLRVVNPLIGS
jgi:toxin-antitoxin system PIN domain toxin